MYVIKFWKARRENLIKYYYIIIIIKEIKFSWLLLSRHTLFKAQARNMTPYSKANDH